MPNPSIVRFDYDSTGVNPDNLISNEIHALTDNFVRAFAPTYGPFFADSVVLFDNANDRRLVRGTDYSITELNQDITLRLGKEVSSVILVLNASISNTVRMTYQVVGGLYQNQADAIANMYTTLLQDQRPIQWVNVLGKPLEFPSTTHLHNLEDVYGFEPFVNAIERVRSAIILSDVPAFEALVDWVNSRLALVTSSTTVNNLTTQVNQNYTTLTAVDTGLTAALQQEITNRGIGDNNLLSLIQSEIQNRITADNMKVTQGYGVGQLNNNVMIGWSATQRLKATVDTTDLGNFVFDSQLDHYLPLSGGTLTGPLVIDTPYGVQPTIHQRGGSGGGLSYYDNNDPDSGVYGYWMTMDSGIFSFSMSKVDDDNATSGDRKAYIDHNGNFVASGDTYAFSDPRLKENFIELNNPFEVINAIQGYQFNWNNHSKLVQSKWGKLDVGFRSDNVKSVLPLAVCDSTHDVENDETYDVVAYDKIIPFHNEGLKILHTRIETLESKLSEMISKYGVNNDNQTKVY